MLAALLAELLALGVFLAACGRLHARLCRDPSASRAMLMDPTFNWLGYFVVMEVAAAMLVVRNAVRAAECLGGVDGVMASYDPNPNLDMPWQAAG